MTIAIQLDEPETLAQCLACRSCLLGDRGQYSTVIEHYRRILDIYQEADQPLKEACILGALGLYHHICSEQTLAMACFQQARERMSILPADSTECKRVETNLISLIGLVYYKQKRYFKAITHFRRSYKLARELDYQFGMAQALEWIGVVYVMWRKYDEADDRLQCALRIFRMLGLPRQESQTLYHISVLHCKLGQFEQAFDIAQQALAINEKVRHQHLIATTISHIAMLQYQMGNRKETIALLEQVITMFETIDGCEKDVEQLRAILGNLQKDEAG